MHAFVRVIAKLLLGNPVVDVTNFEREFRSKIFLGFFRYISLILKKVPGWALFFQDGYCTFHTCVFGTRVVEGTCE